MQPGIFRLVSDEEELRAEISVRLAIARRAAGLTLEELGIAVGAGPGAPAQQVAYRLTAKPPAAWVRLRKACDALGVSADWLTGEGPRLPAGAVKSTDRQ